MEAPLDSKSLNFLDPIEASVLSTLDDITITVSTYLWEQAFSFLRWCCLDMKFFKVLRNLFPRFLFTWMFQLNNYPEYIPVNIWEKQSCSWCFRNVCSRDLVMATTSAMSTVFTHSKSSSSWVAFFFCYLLFCSSKLGSRCFFPLCCSAKSHRNAQLSF